MSDTVSFPGTFALELSPQTRAQSPCLPQAQAGELAALLAHDLARWVPEVRDCDFTVLAALFDPVEILRPGFPLHAELERLTAQAPGQGSARIMALGANENALPDTLAPSPEFAEGLFRLVPFLLRGDAELIKQVGEQLEASLLDIGMASANTALFAQESFKARIEHARHLTVHDLAAMMALQYEHAGLKNVWPLIETALLAPNETCWCDAMPEPLALYRDREIHMALLDANDWQNLGYCGEQTDPERCEFLFRQFEMRQRQMVALFQAHGLEVTFAHCANGQDIRKVLMP